MTNVNVKAEELYPQAGSDLKGYKIGFVDSAAKAAQNDTWTITNASTVLFATASIDSTGTADLCHISSTTANEIILAGGSTGASSGIIIFKGK